MKPFETLCVVVVSVVGLIWMMRSLLRKVLPVYLYTCIESFGVLGSIFIAIVGGGGGGGSTGYVGNYGPQTRLHQTPTSAHEYQFDDTSEPRFQETHHHQSTQHTHHHKKATRRNVSETLKKVVAASQGWQCGHCNRILSASYEVDHITPLADGGSNEAYNLVALCRGCHGHKSIQDRLRWNGEL